MAARSKTSNNSLRGSRVVQNDSRGYRVFKRLLDLTAGLVGVAVLVPVTAVVFAANLLTRDRGSVMYAQHRIGKNGKIFKMYKFRSMYVGAERALKKHLRENPEAAKEYRKYKKLQNDPRVTRVGRVLRRFSIDEIPQFINLINGTMSLVGPRPYLPGEKSEMGEYYETIVGIKPGITGFWQTNGRSNTTFKKRLEMDIDYCRRRSVGTDLKIIAKTFVNVFKKDGAI